MQSLYLINFNAVENTYVLYTIQTVHVGMVWSHLYYQAEIYDASQNQHVLPSPPASTNTHPLLEDKRIKSTLHV